MPAQVIKISGARQHNLKNLHVEIPREKLVVITGLSGSGKSSLAFDTLYAEGQRRYVESLSAYARQFLEQMEKPDVESVSGLSPAIAIEQRTTVAHPRSTVGTVTEVYDHLRVLFAALGRPHCPRCSEPIASRTAGQMAERLLESPEGTPLAILAPVARGRKGAFRKEIAALAKAGLVRARVDGKGRNLAEPLSLDPRRNHRIDVLIDRLILRPGAERRLRASLEKALDLARDVVLVSFEGGRERLLSRRMACVRCDISVGELSPRAFSFNSPHGACPACDGLGLRWAVDPARVIPDDTKSLVDGAIQPWQRHGPRLVREALEDVAARHGFSLETPVRDLTKKARVTRLQFLESLGLGYLTLDRPTTTLSSGEAHRIRLATQIGARMQGILYVLDEPSVGLHQRDNERLIETLKGIRDLGNTVVVVEHDEETIRAADWIVDLGEGAGRLGGRLMYEGPPSSLNGSLTGRYLRGEMEIPLPDERSSPRGQLRT